MISYFYECFPKNDGLSVKKNKQAMHEGCITDIIYNTILYEKAQRESGGEKISCNWSESWKNKPEGLRY